MMRKLLLLVSTLALTGTPALAQDSLLQGKKNHPSSQTSCASLSEATTLLKTFDEQETRARIIKDIRATRDEACVKALKESDDLMIDLLLATVRQNEDLVCKATSSNRQKELIIRLHKISYGGSSSPCKTLKG